MKRRFTFRVKNSLLSQITVSVLIFVITIFIPVSLITGHFQKKSLYESIGRSAFLLADGKAAEINPILTQVEHSVSVLEERLLSTLDENRFVNDKSYREDYLHREGADRVQSRRPQQQSQWIPGPQSRVGDLPHGAQDRTAHKPFD